MHSGQSVVDGNKVCMHLQGHRIDIKIDPESSNLPAVFDSFVNESKKKCAAPFMQSRMTFTKLNRLDFFGDMHATDDYQNLALYSGGPSIPEHEFDHYSKFCCPCVGDSSNDNLSSPQKELLMWYWKLGIGMQRVQRLMME